MQSCREEVARRCRAIQSTIPIRRAICARESHQHTDRTKGERRKTHSIRTFPSRNTPHSEISPSSAPSSNPFLSPSLTLSRRLSKNARASLTFLFASSTGSAFSSLIERTRTGGHGVEMCRSGFSTTALEKEDRVGTALVELYRGRTSLNRVEVVPFVIPLFDCDWTVAEEEDEKRDSSIVEFSSTKRFPFGQCAEGGRGGALVGGEGKCEREGAEEEGKGTLDSVNFANAAALEALRVASVMGGEIDRRRILEKGGDGGGTGGEGVQMEELARRVEEGVEMDGSTSSSDSKPATSSSTVPRMSPVDFQP